MQNIKMTVAVCKEDNPADVDAAYDAGTYARLFPEIDIEAVLLDACKEALAKMTAYHMLQEDNFLSRAIALAERQNVNN